MRIQAPHGSLLRTDRRTRRLTHATVRHREKRAKDATTPRKLTDGLADRRRPVALYAPPTFRPHRNGIRHQEETGTIRDALVEFALHAQPFVGEHRMHDRVTPGTHNRARSRTRSRSQLHEKADPRPTAGRQVRAEKAHERPRVGGQSAPSLTRFHSTPCELTLSCPEQQRFGQNRARNGAPRCRSVCCP